MFAYVDTSIWIAYVEGLPPYQAMIEMQLEKLRQDGWDFCISQAVMMEILYKPYRENDHALVSVYHNLFAKTKLLPNFLNLLEDGLKIIQFEKLKALDAIHVAFAAKYKCELFVTTDPDFRPLKSLPLYWIDLSQATIS